VTDARYVVGIDLGTTHTALSYVALAAPGGEAPEALSAEAP
jgi:molecular chaperone DnaK (HSP70)